MVATVREIEPKREFEEEDVIKAVDCKETVAAIDSQDKLGSGRQNAEGEGAGREGVEETPRVLAEISSNNQEQPHYQNEDPAPPKPPRTTVPATDESPSDTREITGTVMGRGNPIPREMTYDPEKELVLPPPQRRPKGNSRAGYPDPDWDETTDLTSEGTPGLFLSQPKGQSNPRSPYFDDRPSSEVNAHYRSYQEGRCQIPGWETDPKVETRLPEYHHPVFIQSCSRLPCPEPLMAYKRAYTNKLRFYQRTVRTNSGTAPFIRKYHPSNQTPMTTFLIPPLPHRPLPSVHDYAFDEAYLQYVNQTWAEGEALRMHAAHSFRSRQKVALRYDMNVDPDPRHPAQSLIFLIREGSATPLPPEGKVHRTGKPRPPANKRTPRPGERRDPQPSHSHHSSRARAPLGIDPWAQRKIRNSTSPRNHDTDSQDSLGDCPPALQDVPRDSGSSPSGSENTDTNTLVKAIKVILSGLESPAGPI